MTRRGATTLVSILPIDKPAGVTSHDVVSVVRRATGEGRVGHAGTLDPMATGLLVVLVGAYTRLAPYLTAASKDYFATISFGNETDTDDADGATIRTAPVPSEVPHPRRSALTTAKPCATHHAGSGASQEVSAEKLTGWVGAVRGTAVRRSISRGGAWVGCPCRRGGRTAAPIVGSGHAAGTR